ncbi:hypothetical protein BH23BAC1_BH23BAC1_39690 [soil metagenome]
MGVLVLVYAYLPQEVGFTMDRSGLLAEQISREYFFYGMLAMFVISNILCIGLGKALEQLPAQHATSGGGTVFFNSVTKNAVIGWVKSFCFILNAVFIFGLMYIGMLNNAESIKGNNFGLFLFIGPILVIVWILMLIFILIRQKIKSAAFGL